MCSHLSPDRHHPVRRVAPTLCAEVAQVALRPLLERLLQEVGGACLHSVSCCPSPCESGSAVKGGCQLLLLLQWGGFSAEDLPRGDSLVRGPAHRGTPMSVCVDGSWNIDSLTWGQLVYAKCL